MFKHIIFLFRKCYSIKWMIEYFTSLSGKEDQDIFKKRKVRWKEIKTPYDLVLEDREFWVITL